MRIYPTNLLYLLYKQLQCGTVKGKELICSNADCDIRGVSTIILNVTGKLKVNAFVVGSLTYYGSPVIEATTGDLFTLIKG